MQLQEITAYGPNAFGAHRKSGGGFKNTDETVRLIKKTQTTSQNTENRVFLFFLRVQYRGFGSTKTDQKYPKKKTCATRNPCIFYPLQRRSVAPIHVPKITPALPSGMLTALPTDGSYFRVAPKRPARSFLICRGRKLGLYCETVTKKAQQLAADTLRETRAEIKAFELKKRRAVEIEDYDTAKTLKEAIGELKSTEEALTKEAGDNALFRVIDADDNYFRLEPKHSPGKCLCCSGKDDGDSELLLVEEKTDNSLFKTVGVKGGNFRLTPKTSPGKYVACLGKQGAGLQQEENDASLFKVSSVRLQNECDSDGFVSDILTSSKKFNTVDTALKDTWDFPAVSSPTNKLMGTVQKSAWITSRHERRDDSGWQATIDKKEELLMSQNLQIAAYQEALSHRMAVTCESKHNYHAQSSMLWPLQIVDADQIAVRFDPHCCISAEDGDAVILYANATAAGASPGNQFTHSDYSRQGYSRSRQESGGEVLGYFNGRTEWPGVGGAPPLIITSDSFHVSFVAGPCKDPSAMKPWGFKLMATACTMQGVQVGGHAAFARLDTVRIPAQSQLSQYMQKVEAARAAREDTRADVAQLELQHRSTREELDRLANEHKRKLFAEAEARKAFAVAAFVAASAASAAFGITIQMQETKAFRASELQAVELAIIKELETKALANLKTRDRASSPVQRAVAAHKKRENLGAFIPGAKVALISVPGAVGRSKSTRVAIFPALRYEVSIGREEDEAKAFGHVIREKSQFDLGSKEGKQEWKGGVAPMLEHGTRYTVRMDNGTEAVVDGKDMRYSGTPQYEVWNSIMMLHAAADRKKMQVRQINLDTKNKGKTHTWSRPVELTACVESAEGNGESAEGNGESAEGNGESAEGNGEKENEFEVTYDGGKSVVRLPRGKLATHSRFAFSCVWFPNRDSNHKGCCTMEARLEQMAEEEGYKRYERTSDQGRAIKNAQWVHDELAKAYRANKHGAVKAVEVVLGEHAGKHGVLAECLTPKERLKSPTAYMVRLAGAEEDICIYGRDMELIPLPTCAHCAWFDPWQSTVRRCNDDQQSLRFAFLDYPLSPQQPKFYCKADGKSYFVGLSQCVELCWAQDVIGLVVEPITVADTVYSMLADRVKGQATDLLGHLDTNPREALNSKDQPKFFGYRAPAATLAADMGSELAAIEKLVVKAEDAWDGAKVAAQAVNLRATVLTLRALAATLQSQAYGGLREAEIRNALEGNVVQLEKKTTGLEKNISESKAEHKKMKVAGKKLKKARKGMAHTLEQQKEEQEAHLGAQETAVSKQIRGEYKQKIEALQRRVEDLAPKNTDIRGRPSAAVGANTAVMGKPGAAALNGSANKPTSPKKQAPIRAVSTKAETSWKAGSKRAHTTPSAAAQAQREKMLAQRTRQQAAKEETEDEKEELLCRLKIENRQQAKVY
jgi:hypothetical protein